MGKNFWGVKKNVNLSQKINSHIEKFTLFGAVSKGSFVICEISAATRTSNPLYVLSPYTHIIIIMSYLLFILFLQQYHLVLIYINEVM